MAWSLVNLCGDGYSYLPSLQCASSLHQCVEDMVSISLSSLVRPVYPQTSVYPKVSEVSISSFKGRATKQADDLFTFHKFHVAVLESLKIKFVSAKAVTKAIAASCSYFWRRCLCCALQNIALQACSTCRNFRVMFRHCSSPFSLWDVAFLVFPILGIFSVNVCICQ